MPDTKQNNQTANVDGQQTVDFTPGPWAWQRFGDQWCLTGQYGHRPIILSARSGNRHYLAGLMLRDPKQNLLIPFAPDHPDAVLLETAPDLFVALSRMWAFLDDVQTSNPGWMGKLVVQDYGLMNEAYMLTGAALARAKGGVA